MKAVRTTITPERATKILEDTTFQRPLSHEYVNWLVEQIKRGEWKCNGETICLDAAGRCLDGQHRLWACVMAEMPIETFVVHDADPENFSTYDTGRIRNGFDALSIELHGVTDLGVMTRRIISTAIGYIVCTDADGRYVKGQSRQARPSNRTIAEFVTKHPEVVELGRTVAGFGKWPIPASMGLYVLYMVHRGFADCLDGFFRPLATGEGLVRGSPVLLLRQRFSASQKRKPVAREILALLIKTWNLYASKGTVQHLSFRPGSEPFPALIFRPGMKPAKVMRGGPLTGAAAAGRNRRILGAAMNGEMMKALGKAHPRTAGSGSAST